MAREDGISTAEALEIIYPGIENRMVVIPIDKLDRVDPLYKYAKARALEREEDLKMRRAGLGPYEVEVFNSMIRF